MSKVQTLRAFVQQRLSAAAEEIFELFERTIAEYEEELCGQRKLLDAVFKPEVRLHRADVQLVLVSQEEVPPEQQDWSPSLDQEDLPKPPHIKEEWSPSLDQEDPPEPSHIKEEQEELWTSQEGEQLRGMEEADITKFTFTPVPVKSDEDEEKPQSSQLHQRLTEQMKTEADGEDCGGPEPARNSDTDRHLQPDPDDKTSDSSEPETDDSCDWEETREPQSGATPLQNNSGCNSGGKSFSCSECGRRFSQNASLKRHNRIHTGEKPYSCSVCVMGFARKGYLQEHMKVHTGEKPFSCSICGKGFAQKTQLTRHTIVHTGKRPFSCSVCGKSFALSSGLTTHLRVHTGEKPFSCSICKARFRSSSNLSAHARVHTRKKQLSCSVCGKVFPRKVNLTNHMALHTGKKRYSCRVCGRGFTWLYQLQHHRSGGHQCTQLHQRQTEENRDAEHFKMETEGEDCGGPEMARNSDPDFLLQPHTDGKTEDSSQPVTGDKEHQSGSNPMKNNEAPVRLILEGKCFSCSVCKKTFKQRRDCVKHLRIHTGEKPYSCSACGKRFTQSSSLKTHLRIHTGEKPFTCSICQKTFPRRDTVVRHMRVHKREKCLSCSVCGKAFPKSRSLTQHLKVHTGEKPFSCSVSKKGSQGRRDVVKHMTIHTLSVVKDLQKAQL
ncbi:gastrula zinc finger protein XlCGF57.1-like isoform X1 [Micropterus dolomieu]|uniref:gastrula zinc finger protein XlCGF57.1-like isoform X1 n=1 Tax=Micropterus dolomieu TaxID=147949 RepID=UPI001E8EEAB6|nr:gastrula zinc finger protein XlCGF57.1-like isoform X1 [Micropterus dolomieu]